MLQDFGDDDTIKLALWEVAHHSMMKPNIRRRPSATLDRWAVRIDGRHLVPAVGQRNSKLRPISASNIQHSKLEPLLPGKLTLHGSVHKMKPLSVSPQIFREVWCSRISL